MHQIEYRTYPEKCNWTLVTAELNDYVNENTDWEGGGGLPEGIQKSDVILDSLEAARNFINAKDRSYAQLAVRFKAPKKGQEQSKKESECRQKYELAVKEVQTLEQTFHYENAKSDFIGCKSCGSKINRKVHMQQPSWGYQNKNFCPVCGEDLRPESAKKKLDNLRAKRNKFEREWKEAREKRIGKAYDIMWLVKIEYHV